LLYLTLYLHKANRNAQHTILSQSSVVLNSIVEPLPPVPDPPPYEVRRAGLTEQLKDRWNSEIEKLVRNIQTTDWEQKRVEYGEKIATAWSNLRQTEKAQELEQRFKENVVETADGMKQAAEEVEDKTRQPRLLELK
jgi:Altered inheritance of mitochondria 5